jgi:hypothetical protein
VLRKRNNNYLFYISSRPRVEFHSFSDCHVLVVTNAVRDVEGEAPARNDRF